MAHAQEPLMDLIIKCITELTHSNTKLFWEKVSQSNVPQGIQEINRLCNQYDKAQKLPAYKLELLKNIGKAADNRLRENTFIGISQILSLKDKMVRNKFTQNIYECLSLLSEIGNNENFKEQLEKVLQNLIHLIGEQNEKHDLDHLPRLSFFNHITHFDIHLKLDIALGKRITYLYSNDPPSQVFNQGVRKNGTGRALLGGTLDYTLLKNPDCMYFTLHHYFDAEKANHFKYVYIIDSPAILSNEFFANESSEKIKDINLLPRAIDRREIIGCHEFQTHAIQDFQYLKNPHYQEKIKLQHPLKLLFRGDNREFQSIFDTGFKPQGKVSDDPLKWADEQYPSIFVSASDAIERTLKFPEVRKNEIRYVYVIYPTSRAISFTEFEKLKNNENAQNDKEYFLCNGVSTDYILGAFVYSNKDKFHTNKQELKSNEIEFKEFVFNPKCCVEFNHKTFFKDFNLKPPAVIKDNISSDQENLKEEKS